MKHISVFIFIVIILTSLSVTSATENFDSDSSIKQFDEFSALIELSNSTIELGDNLLIRFGILNNTDYVDGYNYTLYLVDDTKIQLQNGTSEDHQSTYSLDTIIGSNVLSPGNYSIFVDYDVNGNSVNTTAVFQIITGTGAKLTIEVPNNGEIYAELNQTIDISFIITSVGKSNAYNITFSYFASNEPVNIISTGTQSYQIPIMKTLERYQVNLTIQPQNYGRGEISIDMMYSDGEGRVFLAKENLQIITLPLVNAVLESSELIQIDSKAEFTLQIYNFVDIKFLITISISSDGFNFIQRSVEEQMIPTLNTFTFTGVAEQVGFSTVVMEFAFLDLSDKNEFVQLIPPVVKVVEIVESPVSPKVDIERIISIILIIFNLLLIAFVVLLLIRDDFKRTFFKKVFRMNLTNKIKFPSKSIIVDGSNVAWEELNKRGKPKIENIVNTIKHLKNYGFENIIVVADAALRYQIENPKELDDLSKRGLVKVMPARVDGDGFILTLSQHNDLMILSNDLFKEYRDEYDWIDKRRIPYSIFEGQVYLHPLFEN